MNEDVMNSINNDPALKFLSNNTANKEENWNPPRIMKSEKKTRQVSLMIKPSLYQQLSTYSKRCDVSLNHLINYVLTDFMKNNS